MAGIYCIENIQNGKVYVGKTKSKDILKYCRKHFSNALSFYDKEKPRHFYNAIRKYGKDSFKISILEEFESIEKKKLSDLEIMYIKKYNSSNNRKGYNMTVGGEGGLTCSKETISKNSILMWSDKDRRNKQSELLKKRWEDPIYKNKIIKAQLKRWTDDKRKIVKVKVKGENNPNAKITESQALQILYDFSNGWTLQHIYEKYRYLINRKDYFYELRAGYTFKYLFEDYPDIKNNIKQYDKLNSSWNPDEIIEALKIYKESDKSVKDLDDIFNKIFNKSIKSFKHLLKGKYFKTLCICNDKFKNKEIII